MMNDAYTDTSIMMKRHCIVTMSNGQKAEMDITFPRPDRCYRLKDIEARLVEHINRTQPKMVHKVVGIHMMRS